MCGSMWSVSDEMFILLHLDSFAVDVYQKMQAISEFSKALTKFQTCDVVISIKNAFPLDHSGYARQSDWVFFPSH